MNQFLSKLFVILCLSSYLVSQCDYTYGDINDDGVINVIDIICC